MIFFSVQVTFPVLLPLFGLLVFVEFLYQYLRVCLESVRVPGKKRLHISKIIPFSVIKSDFYKPERKFGGKGKLSNLVF